MVSIDLSATRANQDRDFGSTGVSGAVYQRLECSACRADTGGVANSSLVHHLLETIDSGFDARCGKIVSRGAARACLKSWQTRIPSGTQALKQVGKFILR